MKIFIFIFTNVLFIISAYAQFPTFDIKKNAKTSEENATITKYTSYIKDVDIPSKYEGFHISSISGYKTKKVYYGAFQGTNIETLHMSNSIMDIGPSAFFGCENLLRIELSSNLKVIGESAFENCSRFTTILIPSSVEKINNRAFANCTNLKYINILNGIKQIGDEVFRDCINITTITIPKSIEKIGSSIFYGCINLKRVRIEAIKPPKLFANIFDDDIIENLIIEVPRKEEQVYKKNPSWIMYAEKIIAY